VGVREILFSTHVYVASGSYPGSCKIGTEALPGAEAADARLDYPHPSLAEVQERVELYFYSPSVLA